MNRSLAPTGSLGARGHLVLAAALAAVACEACIGAAATAPPSPEREYARLKNRAEALYAEGSYARAQRLYEKAASGDLAEADSRWVAFRVADTMWRAKAVGTGSRQGDNTIFDDARRRLEALIAVVHSPDDRDRVWAEAHESLGDFFWIRRNSQNWSQGWPHYQEALAYWSAARDVELARRRYLHMVWQLAEPPWRLGDRYWGYHNIPLNVLENAKKIARRPQDRARAHFLLAMGLRSYGGSWHQRRRIANEFEAALDLGRNNPWHDDALYHHAEWLANQGRVVLGANGQWRQEPDYVRAVALYRRLLGEYHKGETAYYDDAKARIRQITAPQLTATVSNIFLPESEIQFDLRWRNLPVIDLAIYRVDLTRDLDPTRTQRTRNQWIQHIDHSTARKIKDWTFRTKDAQKQKQKHVWGRETSRLEMKLPVGAYLLVATSGGITARELILVTDIAIVVKAWSGNVLAWVCDARDGAPIPGARVHLWTMRYLNQRYTGSDTIARTDHEGFARFEVNSSTRPRESDHGFIVTASVDGRQAFGLGPRSSTASQHESWKIYTVTDRPAYRPGETVHFKITARTNDGSGYATPAGEVVGYEITGPRGKVDQGQLPLNVFGSAWSELALSESMTLGEYQITFYNEGRRRTIGSAKLFRLEEYKLPEFTVNVGTPVDEQGRRKKTFRLGDRVEAEVQASYYFGGPVANANVELLVYQKSFQHFWMPPRQYPWYYAHRRHHDYWGGQGQIIQRKTLKTDSAGRVTISFETPVGGSQDFQYTIEARVTDASRREIVGTGTVRVTRQSYYVYPRPRRNVVGPGETVEVDFKSLDPNDEPLAVEGRVTVTRDRWVEVWLNPADREVTGSALARARRRLEVFPPPVKGGERPWRLKFRGYTSQEILTRTIKTSDEGEATLVFAAHDEGYYRIRWRSEEPAPRAAGSAPILAETTVWVADHTTSELGYRSDGVQIIIDTDTFRAGETAAVMLSVPTNDRYVLFAVEGNDMHSYRLVHVTGTVKLIQLPLGQRHIPNVYLQAHMVSDGRLYSDRKEVVVPPVGNFLDLEVRADRDSYEPRDEGTLTVVTRDADGKPVPAEVSLALVDESVFSIQSEYAADPREFFFNDRQGLVVHTASTFSRKRYVRLVKTDTEALIDARLAGGVGDEGDRNELGMDHLKSGARRARGIAGAYADAPMEKMMALEASDDMEPGPMAQATGAAAPSRKPGGPGGAGGEPAVVVRSDFRSTILWEPDLITGTDGTATVRVKYGDSLTQWKATARAATTGSRFGIGTTTTRTRRPLIARLQAPRFFVVGDTVTLSGVLNNNTDQPMTVEPLLEVTGLKITGILQGGLLVSATAGAVRVPAGGERRVDWVAVVETPGQAKVRLTARSGGHADAMEKTYTVYEHGVEKLIFSSGKVRGESVTVKLQIPARRKAGSTELVVDVSWSMAVTMLDALPYLVDYPYGCTEQTMSRFLPAVVTAGTLKRMELPVEVALGRVFGGIEERFVDTTHPGGGAKRANLRKLDEIVQSGLERLYDFQHSDGGWGWFKGGESDHFMTAYVLWGMSLARVAERDVRGDAMDRAARFLELQIVEEESRLDMQAWMLHALAAYHEVTKRRIVSAPQRAAFDNLFSGRDRLNTYSLALLALALHHYGDLEKATVLVRNLENGVVRDNTPDRSILLERGGDRQPAVMATAHWGSDGPSWRWSAGAVEATAFALKAILAIDPENELIEPATNWLLKNRRGSQWSNTRDTAIVVLALNDYLQTSGELEPELEYELLVNGRLIARRTIKAADALAAPSRFVIDPALIRDGDNEIRIIRRNGEGPIYFAVRATYFSLEEPIPAAGNEIFVRRDYYKLVPRETLLNGYVYDRVGMRDGDYVTSGERVEVIVTIEAKNDYEYLVFEDLKPAGLEAVQITSGKSLFARQLTSGAVRGKFAGDAAEAAAAVRGPGAGLNGSGHDYTGRRRWVHQELRDRKVVLFVDKLAQGVWEIRYLLRAEVPGQFHALPVLGHAMYVPEIRCNSNEVRITVNDRPENPVIAVGE